MVVSVHASLAFFLPSLWSENGGLLRNSINEDPAMQAVPFRNNVETIPLFIGYGREDLTVPIAQGRNAKKKMGWTSSVQI